MPRDELVVPREELVVLRVVVDVPRELGFVPRDVAVPRLLEVFSPLLIPRVPTEEREAPTRPLLTLPPLVLPLKVAERCPRLRAATVRSRCRPPSYHPPP